MYFNHIIFKLVLPFTKQHTASDISFKNWIIKACHFFFFLVSKLRNKEYEPMKIQSFHI